MVIAQALLLAAAVAPVVTRAADWPDVARTVAWLALVVVTKRRRHRGSRNGSRTARPPGPSPSSVSRCWTTPSLSVRAGSPPSPVATLATRGLEALDPYFVRYLPQLLLAVTVTPAALVVVLGLDWIAGLTVALTLPLVPVFMVLIGRLTQGYSDRRLAAMERLGHQVLDLLAGPADPAALSAVSGARNDGWPSSATSTAWPRWAPCGSPSSPEWSSSC